MIETQDGSPSAAEQKREIYIEPATPRGSLLYRMCKRTFDVLASLTLGLVLLPLLLILALAIRLDSPGPALYRQERLGRGGKPFWILKFRTMHTWAEDAGPKWANTDDERCTRLGGKLRRLRLDELPQLWNILIGQMTFVGPRPERPYFHEEFEAYIHGFSHRLAVKPGLTGLAQVTSTELEAEEKIVYDMEYIRTRSLWLDLKLMILTVGAVCKRRSKE